MLTSICIPKSEYQARVHALRDFLGKENLSGIVLFDNYYILYFTGFAFIPTERPMALAINRDGECALLVPRLELEHAQSNAMIARVEHYPEYPHKKHPMEMLKKMLMDMGIQEKIGVDNDGYPWILGYRGPSLSELMATSVRNINGFVEDMMMIKSECEITLIRESIKWGHLAHVLLQRYTRVGGSETEVSARASSEANSIMLDTIGPIYRSYSTFGGGAMASYRGQIGRNAAIPHALANNLTFQKGDVLVTGATAPVWGYYSELERTMIVDPVNSEQQQLFDHMVTLQDVSFEALKPGAKCCDVDKAVREYYEQNDLMKYWKHHVGHAIGLRYHEGPFLDIGDDTEIKPGMVFTIEPGLYSEQYGGFRHSDTVAITEDGIEILTYYPRDLASLTIY